MKYIENRKLLINGKIFFIPMVDNSYIITVKDNSSLYNSNKLYSAIKKDIEKGNYPYKGKLPEIQISIHNDVMIIEIIHENWNLKKSQIKVSNLLWYFQIRDFFGDCINYNDINSIK